MQLFTATFYVLKLIMEANLNNYNLYHKLLMAVDRIFQANADRLCAVRKKKKKQLKNFTKDQHMLWRLDQMGDVGGVLEKPYFLPLNYGLCIRLSVASIISIQSFEVLCS